MANTGESDHQYIKLTSLAQRFGVWEVMEGSLYIWNKQHKKVKCIPFFIPFQGTTTDRYHRYNFIEGGLVVEGTRGVGSYSTLLLTLVVYPPQSSIDQRKQSNLSMP